MSKNHSHDMESLVQEHHELNRQIAHLDRSAAFDEMKLKELKKKKLHLKDLIDKLEQEGNSEKIPQNK